MSRLASGGLIDRSRPLTFRFDGKAYTGFSGDTLASALLANDVRLVGRSFKYHRPRGILTAGSEEPNALVTLRSGSRAEPNTRATITELYESLEATSQNRWPSLRYDAMAINQLFSPLLVAGFYYKTFMWPGKFWEKLYEPLIRRAAGLGALSMEPDPDVYDRNHAFCDLLVIGGGPAGLSATLAAGRAGLRVILVHEDSMLGGQILSSTEEIDGRPGQEWVSTVVDELSSFSNVTVLRRTTLFGVFDGREYGAVERLADHVAFPELGQPRQRLWKIVAEQAFLATGAIERPIVFGGNDRPGVMTASAVSAYVNRFAVAPGRRTVIFTNADSGWATAADLINAGQEVAAVVDTRRHVSEAAMRAASQAGVSIYTNASVEDVHGSTVRAVSVRTEDGRMCRIKADCVAMAGGWNPAIGLASNLGARPQWSDEISSFVATDTPPGMRVIGAAAGLFSTSNALANGISAAGEAAEMLGRRAARVPVPVASDRPVSVAPFWCVTGHSGKAFVDYQHDVTDSDVALAACEGFVSVEHLKRYTTLGMATDQGKSGQLNAHALLAAATGKTIAEAGTVLSRPPYHPIALGVLAGHHRDEHFRPERRVSAHDFMAARGAVFVEVGQWKRPQYFPLPGEQSWIESVNREVNGTRNAVGICDVSTLGKIDVHGPGAGRLLDHLYINTFSKLAVGKARYGVMLREDGFVLDDGTVTRLAEDHFYLTTTTANAGRVMQHIDYARQVLWPELDVQATSVTDQWATYAVAGPRSRALLQKLLPEVPLENEDFPFMAAKEIRWNGVVGRLFRLSFSGEMAYEIAVPAHLGAQLAAALFEVGAPLGVIPYGTEALSVMRIEKGHAAGAELNGQTTAADLGFGGMMSRKKNFIGRIMAERPALNDPDRPRLVGLRPLDPDQQLRGGGHLLPRDAQAIAAHDQGHVTSAALSPTLQTWLGLGLIRRGPERHGEVVRVHDPLRGSDVEVELCSPIFFDPDGERLRA
jgi:sarcosine oxidase subunit alpha